MKWIFVLVFLFSGFVEASVVPAHDLVRTKSGAEIYFFESPNVPIFEVLFVFPGGCDEDPLGKSGLHSLAMNLAARSSTALHEEDLTAKLDLLAADSSFSTDEERTSIHVSSLNKNVDEVLGVLEKQITSPSFDEKIFSRIKSNLLDAIARIQDSPRAILSRALSRQVYAKTEKERPCSGLFNDISSLSLYELKQDYQQSLNFKDAKVLVIGGENKKEILDKVVSFVDRVSKFGTKFEKTVSKEEIKTTSSFSEVWIVPRSGISEVFIGMGMLGPSRKSSDYYALTLSNIILSGTFHSRLTKRLREELGLTYGVQAGFDFDNRVGEFKFASSTQSEKAMDLYQESLKELKKFVHGGITEEELKAAKEYVSGAFPISLSNRYVIASVFFNGVTNGLSPRFIEEFEQKIQAVKLEHVKQALVKHLKVNELRTVFVGDEKKISSQLKKHKINYKVVPATSLL